MKRYILALDQGTTSSRACLFDEDGRLTAIRSVPLTQHYPKPGWVEHDAEEIFDSQMSAARGLLQEQAVAPDQIAAIGIANQRETVIVWNRRTGRPIHKALVWQCRRTADRCEQLKRDGHAESIRLKTGLLPDAYFSGTKIGWILDNVPGAREQAERGELLAGTVDTWLVWKLTGGRLHVTDMGNASRTMLFNLVDQVWDPELCDLLGVPKAMLAEPVASSGLIGMTDPEWFGTAVPIAGLAGDQQAALFGQACWESGMAKNTYGTGCFILMNTGSVPVFSEHRMLTTIAWKIGGEVCFALEGSVFNAGSAIQWLRDELCLIRESRECDVLAESVPDNGGVFLVPAFTGLGAPWWDMYARGLLIGLTRGSNRAHIARATLESIAFQSLDVIEAMRQDGVSLRAGMRVDGGAAKSDFLMQFQADLLGTDVVRPALLETTAAGAAWLAGLGCGLWANRDVLSRDFLPVQVFHPRMDREEAQSLYATWKRAVQRAGAWVDEG